MNRLFLLSAVCALTALAGAQPGRYVTIGDPAPAFKPAKWLKGTPVASFEPGKLYVVEFWATWCGPCKENIPHLTELAKKYQGQVSIIGVDIWESAKGGGDYMKKVTDFVKSQGSKMDYNVAVDTPRDDIANAWMKAASEGGIPCSFIIGRDGKVAWIGHPAKMEETLKQVIDGTYDATAARNKREIELEVTRPIGEAMEAKNYKAAAKAIDSALEKRPQLKYSLMYSLLVALYHSDLDRGMALSQQVLKESNGEIGAYQMMSSIFATQTDLSPAAYKFGLGIIDEATTKGLGVFMFKAMKAATYFNMGNKDEAIKVGEEAVALSEKDPNSTPELRELLKKNLAKFKAAK